MEHSALKNEYIQLRNKNNFNLNFFFKYYRDKGGRLEMNQFYMLFQQYSMGNLDEIISYLDFIFKVTTLHNFIETVEEQRRGFGRFLKVVQ